MSEPYFDWLAFMARVEIERAWCVAICVAGREKAVQAELALAGWSTYLPMQTDERMVRHKRRIVRTPLLARYLFCAVNAGADAASPDIDGLVAIRRAAVAGRSVVRLDILAALMLAEMGHGFDATWKKPRPRKGAFACGQVVTVRAGVFGGYDALILKVLGKREVLAQVSLFGRPVEGVFQAANLEAVEARREAA